MEQAAKRENINTFIQALGLQDSIITEFDEDLCTAMMDHITVFSEHEIRITFRNGFELARQIIYKI